MDAITARPEAPPPAAAPAAPSRLARWRDRWRDPSLTALLLVQGLTVFVLIPGRAAGIPVPETLVVGLLLVFAALAILMASGRWTLLAGLLTLVLAAVNALGEFWRHGAHALPLGDAIGLLTFTALTVVVFHAAFGPGRFSGHRMRGAVVLYLNAALLFTFAHRLLAELLPGAYAHLPPPGDRAAFRAATEYFSFTTLTSLGYGDIVPVHPFARALSTLEGAVGQLLPVTLIARAVTRAMRTLDDDSP